MPGHSLPDLETVFSPMLKNAVRLSGVHLKLFGFILGCVTKCLTVKLFQGNLNESSRIYLGLVFSISRNVPKKILLLLE